jgi:hypothetical protein
MTMLCSFLYVFGNVCSNVFGVQKFGRPESLNVGLEQGLCLRGGGRMTSSMRSQVVISKLPHVEKVVDLDRTSGDSLQKLPSESEDDELDSLPSFSLCFNGTGASLASSLRLLSRQLIDISSLDCMSR